MRQKSQLTSAAAPLSREDPVQTWLWRMLSPARNVPREAVYVGLETFPAFTWASLCSPWVEQQHKALNSISHFINSEQKAGCRYDLLSRL